MNMVKYVAMVAMGRKNWLLIITAILFLVSVGIVVYKLYLGDTGGGCEFKGSRVKVGQRVNDVDSNEECLCNEQEELVCVKKEDMGVGNDLKTDNLKFDYEYVNSLESFTPNDTRVIPVDINQNGNEIEVIIEREGMCSEDLKAPNQAGYYEVTEDSLILSSITGDDPSLYTVVCLMSNTYKIANFPESVKEGYKVYYRNEKGQQFDLGACVYNGVLYGENDVFNATDKKQICTCEDSKVFCD